MTLPVEPGRPITLGAAADLADASNLLAIVVALHRHRGRTRASVSAVFREALWWMWEKPRLPQPLVAGKYPQSYPWSEQARAKHALHRASGGTDSKFRGVVLEHLIPARSFMIDALNAALDLDAEGFLTMLWNHGPAAIVTPAEDKMLTAVGLADQMPTTWDGADLWARPRLAGLALDGFAPLNPPLIGGPHS